MIRLAVFLAVCGGSALQSQAPQPLTLRRSARVDGSTHLLVQVDRGVASAGGVFAFTQPQSQQVFVVASSGAIIRKVGRPGSGPGDFRAVGQIGFLADTLWVEDPALNRITLFDPTGKPTVLPIPPIDEQRLREVLPVPMRALAAQFARFRVMAMSVDGSILLTPIVSSTTLEARRVYEAPILSVARDGRNLRLVGSQSSVDVVYQRGQGAAARFVAIQPPLTSRPLTFVSPEGFIVVVTTDFTKSTTRLHRLSARGDTVYQHRLSFAAQPLGEHFVDSVVDALAKREKHPEDASMIKQAWRPPPSFPPYTWAIPVSDGSIWLRGKPVAGKVQWTRLAPNGKLAASVELTTQAIVLAFDRDAVWLREWNSDGEESVVRYTLTPSR